MRALKLKTRDHVLRTHFGKYRFAIANVTNAMQQMKLNWNIQDNALWGKYMCGSMMASSFYKSEERIQMTLNTKHIEQLYVETNSLGEVRGYCHGIANGEKDVGIMQVKKILYGKHQPFESTVPAIGDANEDWNEYFASSDQIPTFALMQANDEFCGGMLIQKMPASATNSSEDISMNELEHKSKDALDVMRSEGTLGTLNQLISPYEKTLDDCKVLPVDFFCRCSQDALQRWYHQLPVEEQSSIQKQGELTSTCGYCNATYELII